MKTRSTLLSAALAWVACLLLSSSLLNSTLSLAQEATAVDFAGPARIAKLLWKANPTSAASTLFKALETGLDRQLENELKISLAPLQPLAAEVLSQADASDPRYAPSLATLALLDPAAELPDWQATLAQLADVGDRELAFRAWQQVDSRAASAYFERSLTDPETTSEWGARMMRRALQADSATATKAILEHWSALPQSLHIVAIEPLSSSARSMAALADAVALGIVHKDLVNTNQLRKWQATENLELTRKIEAVWGKIRESDDVERQALVASTVALLRSGVRGSVGRGDKIFERVCSQCHQLHGKGYEVGPNITGNGRGNLDQLVSNVLDPSLVIGEAFQAKTVLTTDGEVVAGLVAAENDRYLKIKVQGGKVIEFDKRTDIEQVKTSSKSLMPEGLETQLTEQELVDLFAYLCLLKPLGAEDNELIPGAPASLIEP